MNNLKASDSTLVIRISTFAQQIKKKHFIKHYRISSQYQFMRRNSFAVKHKMNIRSCFIYINVKLYFFARSFSCHYKSQYKSCWNNWGYVLVFMLLTKVSTVVVVVVVLVIVFQRWVFESSMYGQIIFIPLI